ncbi:MAG: phosphotransferase [Caldilineaceae bacterium]
MLETTVLLEHLQNHAPAYFPELVASPSVELLQQQVRATSVLFRFRIVTATNARVVIVKMPLPQVSQQGPTPLERPCLTTLTDPLIKVEFEYRALAQIYQHFTRLQDDRFDAIHPLEYLPDFPAIIMEEKKAPNLRHLLMQTHRLRMQRSVRDFSQIFHNAGAWLRAYHALPKVEYTLTRHATRADFVQSINDFAAFLSTTLGNRAYVQQLATWAVDQAEALLPDLLPMGLGHGDYATRNILVGPADCVTVLDTLSKWQTPIYEDIAYFLFRLKAAGPQALGQGLLFSPARLAAYEQAFLQGYWGTEPIPYAQIRLFEVQALLDYWTSQSASVRGQNRSGAKRFKNQAQRYLLNRFLYGYSRRLM